MAPDGGTQTLDVLWTGGWDSTFRLLSALHLEKAEVRPHYVFDPSSPYAELEIDAMQRVRTALMHSRPGLAEMLLPTASMSLDDLPEDEAQRGRFERLRERAPGLSPHYERLARYARHVGADELEVGCRRGGPLASLLVGNKRRVREHPFPAYRLSDEARMTDLALLERFTFSLVELDRGDMRRIALERGFLEALEMTWFCQAPRNGQACGVCEKCHHAVVDGLGHLLAPSRRRLHDIKWFTRWAPWQSVVTRVMG